MASYVFAVSGRDSAIPFRSTGSTTSTKMLLVESYTPGPSESTEPTS